MAEYRGSSRSAGLSVPTSSETGRVSAGWIPRRRVQGELADGDGHPTGALIAQTEDPLVVGDDDEPDVRVRALAEELRDPVAVGRRDPRPARPADDVAELLARAADGRRVDDGQELLEVLGEHAVEQRRVAILERGQPDIALERVVLAAQVLELELDLLVDGQDAIRQEPAKLERVAFRVAEGEVLGQQPAAEQSRPRQRDRCRPAGRDGIERSGQRAHPGEHTGRAARHARPGAQARPSHLGRLAAGHDQCADHPVCLVSGQVADVQVRARRVEGDRRLAARSGRDRDLGRARSRGPAPCPCGGVRGSPRRRRSIHGRSGRRCAAGSSAARRPARPGDPLVVRVVDPDLGGHRTLAGRRAQAAAMPARPSERTRPPTRATRPGRRTVVTGADRSGHRQRRAPARDQQHDRADAAGQEHDAHDRRMLSSVRSGATTAPGRARPAMTRDGHRRPRRR